MDGGYHSQRPRSNVTRTDGGSRLDEYFRVLADSRRRYVLHYLREEKRASIGATARQIAAWERGCPPDDVSEDTLENLKISLYHTHLPPLRELAILKYDRPAGMLVYREPPDVVQACLDLSSPRDLPH